MVTTQKSSPPRADSTSGRRGPTSRPSRWLASASFRLLLESALIVLSVLIGFALSEWGSRQADRAHAAAALESFRGEIQENLATLERARPEHVRVAERLAGVTDSGILRGETGFDVFAAIWTAEIVADTSALREAAWQTAVSTGALRLLDYQLAALLSETYLEQAGIRATRQRMADRFSDASNFEPQSRNAMVRVHWRLVADLASQEEHLIKRYRLTLQALPATVR